MENVPVVVGVPVIAPVFKSRTSPVGSVPSAEKAYGGLPPDTGIGGLLKGCPTSPELKPGQFDMGPLVATTNVQEVEAVTPFESFTEMVKLPPADGVPAIAPVEAFKDKPK